MGVCVRGISSLLYISDGALKVTNLALFPLEIFDTGKRKEALFFPLSETAPNGKKNR